MTGLRITPQEALDVLSLYAQGYTAVELARRGPYTQKRLRGVSIHLKKIYGTNSLPATVHRAIKHGDIPIIRRRGPLLTARQCELLGHLAEGRTEQSIARLMDIEVQSVKSHRRDVGKRWGTRNGCALVYLGHVYGVL